MKRAAAKGMHEQLWAVVSVVASKGQGDDWPRDSRRADQRCENNLPFAHGVSLPWWWGGRHVFPQSAFQGPRSVAGRGGHWRSPLGCAM